MINLDSDLSKSMFTEAGHRFASYYQVLSHEASQGLKPELRLKMISSRLQKSRYQTVKEIERNSIALLELERNNLFYAIQWLHENADWKLVCQIVDDLATYFHSRSYWPEWTYFAELASTDADAADDPSLKAIALNNLSVVYRQLDRFLESIQCSQESLALCQKLEDRYGEGLALGNLGGTYVAQKDLEASLESYTAAIQVFEKLGESYEQAQCLMGIGIVLARQQKLDEASSYLRQSIKTQRKIADRFGEAQALNNLGIVQRMQTRFGDAIKSFQKSLRIKQEIGDQQGIANSLSNLAVTYERSGQFRLAVLYWGRTLSALSNLNSSDAERAAQRLEQARAQMKERT
jgi:tetratricopeptide (TPR) repeat protein